MEFTYDLVGAGWAAASINHQDTTTRLSASYLSDAPGELLLAVWTLTDGDTGARCSWAEEPGEYRWLFHRGGESVDMHVLWFDELWGNRSDEQGRIVFETTITLRSLVQALASAAALLHQTHGFDGYRSRWVEHDFPLETLELLQAWLDEPSYSEPT